MVTRKKATVTRIRQSARQHLYLEEWMEHRGLSDEQLAGRLEVARETVTRYRTQQHRLNPDKMAGLAHALDCEPEELWSPPSKPNLNAVVKGLPDDQIAKAADMLKLWVSRG